MEDGRQLPRRPAQPQLPGSDASAPGGGRAPKRLARRASVALVEAAASGPCGKPAGRTHLGVDLATASGGCRASRLRPDRGDPGEYVPGQQRGGMHEQRVADAAVAAQADEPTDARPEAALLELPCVEGGQAEGPLPVSETGPAATDVRLLGAPPERSRAAGTRTVRHEGYAVRQSHEWHQAN